MVILYKATWQRVRGVHLPSKFHRSQSNPASYWMCRKKSVPWKPHLATRVRARSWIWLVQACPTNAPSNWDLRYLEDRWLTRTLCQGPWVIPEHSSHGTLSCCGDHCHRGVMLLGQQQCLGGWCMASIQDPKVTSRTYDCNEMIHVIHSARRWFSCSGWLSYDWSSDW